MQVEQIDREAAAAVYASEGNEYDAALVPGGGCDHWPIVEAFARHRHQARAEVVGEIVAWLREGSTRACAFAAVIEAKFGGRNET